MQRISCFIAVASAALGVLLAFMGSPGFAVAIWSALAVITQSKRIADICSRFVGLRVGRRRAGINLARLPASAKGHDAQAQE